MRVTTEVYDEHGVATTSVSELKTIMKSVDARTYTLVSERAVKLGNQFLPTTVQERTMGFSGENGQQKVESVKKVGDSELVLNGRKIPCEVRQAIMNENGGTRTTATAYYSPEVAPHVLRRELTIVSGAGAEPATTTEEVVALGMPYDVLGQRRTASFVHTVHKVPKQSKVTVEVCCDDVPGGIVAQWTKELDADGKLIGRTMAELIEFHVEKPTAAGPPMRPRRFDRKRPRRADEKMSLAPRGSF